MSAVSSRELQAASQKWRTGVRLARRLNCEFATGRATRPALEVERVLVICRHCPAFAGDDCSEIALRPEGRTYAELLTSEEHSYVELLTREEHYCRRWTDGTV